MRKQQVLHLLTISKPLLKEKYGVTKIALFGSTARDTANPNSDIDILIDFDSPATSKRYFGVLFYLEDLLQHPIDLITENALRPELRPYIEKETIYV